MKNKKLLFILIIAIIAALGIMYGIAYFYQVWLSQPMIMISRESCDVDGDYDCDDDDFIMFKNVLGECVGGNYNSLADANHDDCITLEDQQRLFPTKPIKDTARICQIELPSPGAPGVNYTKECQKIIEERYPNKKCTFEFGPEIPMDLGACSDCIIECK